MSYLLLLVPDGGSVRGAADAVAPSEGRVCPWLCGRWELGLAKSLLQQKYSHPEEMSKISESSNWFPTSGRGSPAAAPGSWRRSPALRRRSRRWTGRGRSWRGRTPSPPCSSASSPGWPAAGAGGGRGTSQLDPLLKLETENFKL